MICDKMKFMVSSKNNETKIDEKSSMTEDILVFTLNFDSHATLLNYFGHKR